MSILKERVVAQIKREYPVGEDGANDVLNRMSTVCLFNYISNEMDEMLKERDDKIEQLISIVSRLMRDRRY